MDTDKNHQSKISADLALNALKREEALLLAARGRSFNPQFWSTFLIGILMIGLSLWGMDQFTAGLGTLVVGILLLSNASQIRTNLRIDAVVELITKSKDKSL